MQDKNDTKTGNLFLTPNAKRQAAFKSKMREAGYKQKQIWMHEKSYELGFKAGEMGSGTISDFPANLKDKKSWALGYIDGAIKSQTWA